MDPEEFSALSKKQISALANVAFGGRGLGVSQLTLRSLERRGMIKSREVIDRSEPLVLRYYEWDMTLLVHYAFCVWCSAHYQDEDDDSEAALLN